ncbi:hypothetical protein [Microbacterium gorillae]|nr:hypothetical protein [Microbacterium gorillae]
MSDKQHNEFEAERALEHAEDNLEAPEETLLGGILPEPVPTDPIGGPTED